MQYITSEQMKKVDEIAVKKYKIKIRDVMENAGRNLADFVSKFKPEGVVVLYGKGNNGGGSLVAARYLSNKGINVSIIYSGRVGNKNVKYQLKLLKKIGIKPKNKIEKSDIIIDALLGYNIKGNPRGRVAELIREANLEKKGGTRIIALDLASGVDPNTGKKYEPYIKADYTLTLALPKKGLKKTKNLFLVNIGIPKKVYSDLGIKVGDYFKKKEVIKVN